MPTENRIDNNNVPQEEWIEIGKNQIHIDHYIGNDTKGVVIIYHGVGGMADFCPLSQHRFIK